MFLAEVTVLIGVSLQHLQYFLMFESSLKSLVFPDEAYPEQPIPVQKVNIRQWILRLNSHDAALHLGRRLEIVLSHLDEVVNSRQQLHIHTQPTIQIRPRLGN